LRASREWSAEDAPGDETARLLAVRVRTEEGVAREAVDIRKPVGIEMEYQVLKGGTILVPNFHFFNEEGAYLFVSIDVDQEWHRRPKPRGRYTSTAWIPGNLLAEGTIIVGVSLSTMDPMKVHFYEPDAVAFHVVDSLEGGSARGDYAGPVPGPVRPLLKWETKCLS
jgi:lipopolysaccharide transport system ATP-binding protein